MPQYRIKEEDISNPEVMEKIRNVSDKWLETKKYM